MTPPLFETQLDVIVRSLRDPGLRIGNIANLLRKQGKVREVRFVPGSASTDYLLPDFGLAVVIQPAVFPNGVLKILENVAKRETVKAIILIDNRWRLAGDLPMAIGGKPFRFLGLAGPRG